VPPLDGFLDLLAQAADDDVGAGDEPAIVGSDERAVLVGLGAAADRDGVAGAPQDRSRRERGAEVRVLDQSPRPIVEAPDPGIDSLLLHAATVARTPLRG
jgi:hypothetical protein